MRFYLYLSYVLIYMQCLIHNSYSTNENVLTLTSLKALWVKL
jgi:hypothetical protein